MVSSLRAPVVAGVAGGVGTTTLAVALRGHDAGRRTGPADILACRGTLGSLRRVAAVLGHAGPGPRPVVAVTLEGVRVPAPVRVRLQALDLEVAAVVVLPHVDHWLVLADPLAEAAGLLVEPPPALPRALRRYAAALRELAAAVVRSGRLNTPPAPAPRVPLVDRLCSAARPAPSSGVAAGVRASGMPRTQGVRIATPPRAPLPGPPERPAARVEQVG
jgi:hypothetical protein